MFTPTTLPNQPALAGDYDLGDGRYARVLLKKLGSQAGHVQYESQAYQVNDQGQFVLDDAGWPVRTPSTPHSINLSGLAARTAARDPGWVKYVPRPGLVLDPLDPPAGWLTGNGAPTAAAEEGQFYMDLVATGNASVGWVWSCGEFESFRRGKVAELQQILVERDFEAQAALL